MRRLVVSDIHGHRGLLECALKKVNYRPGVDRLYLLGDYIDRGPDSKGTVELVMALVAEGAVALMGNHEDLLLRVLKGDPDPRTAAFNWLLNGGGATLASYGAPLPEEPGVLYFFPEVIAELVQQYIPLEHREFFASLPLAYEEEEFLFVHAGLKPGLPLAAQDRETLLWSRDPTFWLHPAPAGEQMVVFGHTPTLVLREMLGEKGAATEVAPWFGPRKIDVDTGVHATGILAVVELPDRFTLVSSK